MTHHPIVGLLLYTCLLWYDYIWVDAPRQDKKSRVFDVCLWNIFICVARCWMSHSFPFVCMLMDGYGMTKMFEFRISRLRLDWVAPTQFSAFNQITRWFNQITTWKKQMYLTKVVTHPELTLILSATCFILRLKRFKVGRVAMEFSSLGATAPVPYFWTSYVESRTDFCSASYISARLPNRKQWNMGKSEQNNWLSHGVLSSFFLLLILSCCCFYIEVLYLTVWIWKHQMVNCLPLQARSSFNDAFTFHFFFFSFLLLR